MTQTSAPRFSARERAAWAGFLGTHAAVTRALSAAMEAEHRLTISEFEVLLTLSTQKRLRMSQLAARAYLTPSGLTRLVDRLVARGLIRRCVDPDDGRAGYLILTEDGRSLFDIAVAGHVRRVQEWFLWKFSTDEQRLLGDLWKRFEDLSDGRQ